MLAIDICRQKNKDMKRLKQITLVIAAMLLVVGCNKENAVTPTPEPTVRSVSYIVCGEQGQSTVKGDAEWDALLDSLLDAVDGGCNLTFWDASHVGGMQGKENVEYRTASRDSVFIWGERMYDQGYSVSIVFDSIENVYVGSAIKLLSDSEPYHVRFIIDEIKDTSVNGIGELVRLFGRFIDTVTAGYGVDFWCTDSSFYGNNRQHIRNNLETYNTEIILQWCLQQYASGHAISVGPKDDHPYAGYSAISVSLPIFQYQIPLAEYLPGTWVFGREYMEYWDEESPFIGFCQCYGYEYNDSLVFSDTTVYFSALESCHITSSGTYEILDNATIRVPFITSECGSLSRIVQISPDTLLIQNYTTQAPVVYTPEDKCDYRYIFVRVH